MGQGDIHVIFSFIVEFFHQCPTAQIAKCIQTALQLLTNLVALFLEIWLVQTNVSLAGVPLAYGIASSSFLNLAVPCAY